MSSSVPPSVDERLAKTTLAGMLGTPRGLLEWPLQAPARTQWPWMFPRRSDISMLNRGLFACLQPPSSPPNLRQTAPTAHIVPIQTQTNHGSTTAPGHPDHDGRSLTAGHVRKLLPPRERPHRWSPYQPRLPKGWSSWQQAILSLFDPYPVSIPSECKPLEMFACPPLSVFRLRLILCPTH